MDRSKGMAYCGLACCVCSENATCAGCRNEGCKDKEWCKSFNCCKGKKLNSCWECADFPCQNQMLDKLRVRTFAKIIAEFGEDKLMDALEKNEAKDYEHNLHASSNTPIKTASHPQLPAHSKREGKKDFIFFAFSFCISYFAASAAADQ